MTQSKKIALTGGIGSGKSCAAQILREEGFPVFSCDEIYAQLLTEEKFLLKIEGNFPGSVKDGKLDRTYLSSIVFCDPLKREELNRLTHPAIMEKLFLEMENFPLSFAEVPLLYESGTEKLFDGVLVITRDRKVRIEALKKRDGLSEEQAIARIESQQDWENPPLGAYVIQNDGYIHDLRIKIQKFLENLV